MFGLDVLIISTGVSFRKIIVPAIVVYQQMPEFGG